MAHFSKGQFVTFLYVKGKGTIVEIKGNKALVEDEDGFEQWYLFSDIALIHSEDYKDEIIAIRLDEIEEVPTYREVANKSISNRRKKVWEIDLHIEELIDSTRGMSNTDILMKQMSEFKSTFKKAKKQGVETLIVIHGVGEGVLKNEIRSYLTKQDQIEFFDGEYSEYGKGATAIEFHPNW